ncbi:LysM domain containing protein [Freshwater phage uvFW-CGR-AMD-COM-C403]|nr:LysM domain containing protein [Freshwater phage uvFW-CGR-AMD-COM-C403]
MAAKKATTRKYRQAKQAAKPAAKAAFPGKKQAAKRDPKLKISLEDKQIADEVKATAKSELGKKYYLSKSEFNARRGAELEKFRESMREEFGEYGGKKATPAEAEAAKPKPATKKKAVSTKGKSLVENGKVVSKARAEEIMSDKKKPAAKKAAVKPAKTMGEVSKAVTDSTKSTPKMSKSAANKAAWAKMTPEQRRNWNANKPGAKPTAASTTSKPTMSKAEMKQQTQKAMDSVEDSINRAKRPTLADLKRNEAKGLEEAKARVAAKNKALANSAKGKTQTPQAEKAKATAKPEGKAKVAKKGSRTVRATKFVAKKFPLVGLGIEVGSIAKGSTVKDLKEINRLKAKLGDKPMSAKEGAATQASSLANLATMGLVGKTRRQRMDELNAKIKKQEAKRTKENKALRYGPGGESLVPGTKAYKSGSKTRPSASAASTKPTVGAGGSTTKYTVKRGDVLENIAKSAGVSMSEIKAANPYIMKTPKYKKGAMIWAGTKVNIPKKK